jgi:hypothetical protein
VKILRLGNSNDAEGRVAPEDMTHRVLERALHEATGEDVETVIKRAWPTPELPRAVARWMETLHPDVVVLRVPAFWFNYESVPLKLERKLGRLGKSLGDAGFKAAGTPWLADNALFHAGRRLAQVTVGGATNFTTEEVIENVSAVVRTVLRAEGAAFLLSGPGGRVNHAPTRRAQARDEARRLRVHEALRDLCQQLHVEYLGSDVALFGTAAAPKLLKDRLHSTGESNAARASDELDAVLRALGRPHPRPSGAPV